MEFELFTKLGELEGLELWLFLGALVLFAALAAMVAGTKAPCVLTSRGDSAESKLYSIALAALSAK